MMGKMEWRGFVWAFVGVITRLLLWTVANIAIHSPLQTNETNRSFHHKTGKWKNKKISSSCIVTSLPFLLVCPNFIHFLKNDIIFRVNHRDDGMISIAAIIPPKRGCHGVKRRWWEGERESNMQNRERYFFFIIDLFSSGLFSLLDSWKFVRN